MSLPIFIKLTAKVLRAPGHMQKPEAAMPQQQQQQQQQQRRKAAAIRSSRRAKADQQHQTSSDDGTACTVLKQACSTGPGTGAAGVNAKGRLHCVTDPALHGELVSCSCCQLLAAKDKDTDIPILCILLLTYIVPDISTNESWAASASDLLGAVTNGSPMSAATCHKTNNIQHAWAMVVRLAMQMHCF